MKNLKCFTLAEVLITLSILGVVAAISIPSMIQQYQKRVMITKIQMAYSDLQKAATNIQMKTGCSDVECYLNYDYSKDNPTKKFVDLAGLKNYQRTFNWHYFCCLDGLKAKECKNSGPSSIFYTNKAKNMGYEVSNVTFGTSTKKYLSIGLMLKIQFKSYDYLYYGKDIFSFMIYDNFNVSPVGGIGSDRGNLYNKPMEQSSENLINNYCSLEKVATYSSSSGTSCVSKIIKDGWKITYF